MPDPTPIPDLESLDLHQIIQGIFFGDTEQGTRISDLEAERLLLAWANKRSYEAILELIGKTKPYKGGSFAWWDGRKYLRAELRAKAKARYDGGQDANS